MVNNGDDNFTNWTSQSVDFIFSCIFCDTAVYPDAQTAEEFGQAIREEGPQSHLEKSGTPTMGGLVIQLGVPGSGCALVSADWQLGLFPDSGDALFRRGGFY